VAAVADAVLVAPYYDPATRFWNPYVARWLRRQLEQRGFSVEVLWADDAVKEKYDAAVARGRLILGAGHGNEGVFTGQYHAVLESAPVPEGKYDGKCFAPVSCLVGKKLLPDMESKSKQFCGLGELTEYIFVANPYVEHKGDDIWEDKWLGWFLDAEYTFALSLADGKTAGEAYDAMIRRYYENADKVEKEDFETAYYLRYDAYWRKFFGDRNWSVQPSGPPQPPPCPWRCPWCNAEFGSADDLKAHVKERHAGEVCPPPPPPEKRYACPWCGAEFGSIDELKQHACTAHLRPCKLAAWLRRRLACPLVPACGW
jgi:uncharacterized C2H2 Zn-finger protein